MRSPSLVFEIGVAVFLALGACSQDRAEIAAKHGKGTPVHPRAAARVLTLDPTVAKESGLKTAHLRRESWRGTLELTGEIAADPDRSADLSSPVAGRIEAVHFVEGSEVKKGQSLVVLRVPDLGRVRGAYAATQAKARAARLNQQRQEVLVSKQLTLEQSYLDAKAEAEALDADAASLREQILALGVHSGGARPFLLELRAPCSGSVVFRDAVVGQPVPTQQVLARIVALDQVLFSARVFEKDLAHLKVDMPVEVFLHAFEGRAFPGRLEYIGQQVDVLAHTLTGRIRLANPEGLLRIGLFGRARVFVDVDSGDKESLIVPRGALMQVGGRSVVFVKRAANRYEVREVRIGRQRSEEVEILDGLQINVEVVVEGAFTLKSLLLRSEIEEE